MFELKDKKIEFKSYEQIKQDNINKYKEREVEQNKVLEGFDKIQEGIKKIKDQI